MDFKDHTYKVALTKPAAVRFGVPVRKAKVKAVTVNGKPAQFTIEPWIGYGMLRVTVPETQLAVLKIETEGDSNSPTIAEVEQAGDQPGYQLVLKKVAASAVIASSAIINTVMLRMRFWNPGRVTMNSTMPRAKADRVEG